MSLHTASMLVKLTVRHWNGFKKDRDVSDQVDVTYATKGGAGNYNKRLLERHVLHPIQRKMQFMRVKHKFFTVPWCYDGVDLLPSKLYFQYTEIMRKGKDDFDTAVTHLITSYPAHIAAQSTKLGKMFKVTDYPTVAELRSRFDVDLKFFPVPRAGHYVLDLEAGEAEKLRLRMERQLLETQQDLKTRLYQRTLVQLKHAHDRLANPDNVFRDTLLPNLAQFGAVLPDLNIIDDPKIERAAELINSLYNVAPNVLRMDPKVRAAMASAIHNIIVPLEFK